MHVLYSRIFFTCRPICIGWLKFCLIENLKEYIYNIFGIFCCSAQLYVRMLDACDSIKRAVHKTTRVSLHTVHPAHRQYRLTSCHIISWHGLMKYCKMKYTCIKICMCFFIFSVFFYGERKEMINRDYSIISKHSKTINILAVRKLRAL